MENMMNMEIPEPKEFFWCAKIDKSSKTHQWEGRDDGIKEQLILKKACLGVGAKDNERNIIEVTSFNSEQTKIQACICSLTCGKNEDVSLADLSIFPPAIFTLVQGTGPVHLVGNHMIMDDEDELDSEEDLTDDGNEEDLSGLEDDMSEDEQEEIKEAFKELNTKPKKAVAVQKEESEGEEEEEEKKVEVKPVANKKRKATREKKGLSEKENNKVEPGSPQKKKKATEEAKTPKTPKTPQQKENKLPASAKKTPAKVYETVDEVKEAIKKYPGGKPRKEEKFANWVKSAFRVKDEAWVKELWTAHKKEAGL